MQCPRCGKKNMTNNGLSPGGKKRWRCKTGGVHCYSTTEPESKDRAGAKPSPKIRKRVSSESGLYVITWAQNATPVHKGFMGALHAYCKAENAELTVIPGRYKNPTSRWTGSQANEEVWSTEVMPYLFDGRKSLNGNLQLVGDIKIQPTATHPLTGFESLTHGESCIIGHPKFQAKAVATPSNKIPKLMMTTGACTVANYTDTRAGKTGNFHHVIGALVVQVVNRKIFHVRQAHYCEKNKGFIDLDKAYYADGSVKKAPRYKALVMGDAHWRFADKGCVDATFGELCDKLDPETLIWHDVMDAYACNPHHGKDPFKRYAKRQSGYDDVRKEVDSTIDWIIEKGKGRQNVIVPSNHDNMIKRYIVREDWREDPVNAEFYLETALSMIRHTKMTEIGASTPDPFQQLVNARNQNNIYCIPCNGSYKICDIELALHGDQGPSGARGSRMNIRNIGVRTIIGHSHSPGADGGCWQTGTLTKLEAEYTGPLGAWLNTHITINAFGKRCLMNYVGPRYGFFKKD